MRDIELAGLLDRLNGLCYESATLIAECKANNGADYVTTARLARLIRRNARLRVAVESRIYKRYHAALNAAYEKGKQDALAEST